MDTTALKRNYFQLLLQHMQRYLRFHAHPTIRYHHERRIQPVYSLLQNISGAVLLDVGCAEGLDVYALARRSSYIIGLDLSLDAIKRAANNNPPTNAFFVRGDAEYLPFRNASISITLCLDVLEHLPTPTNALKELMRISKELIVVAVPLAANPPLKRLLTKLRWLKSTPINIQTIAAENGVKELPEHGHLHKYSVERIKKELIELKLHKIEKITVISQVTVPLREKVLSRFPKLLRIFIQLDKLFSKLFPIGRWGAVVLAISP